jgi:hypothetical protein
MAENTFDLTEDLKKGNRGIFVGVYVLPKIKGNL